jgi:hypothetical protein
MRVRPRAKTKSQRTTRSDARQSFRVRPCRAHMCTTVISLITSVVAVSGPMVESHQWNKYADISLESLET